jgi:spermidine/putrescine transport system substrate-binding protein
MIDRRRLLVASAAAPLIMRRTARAQEPLIVLGWPGYVDQPMLDRFTERTGLVVQFETLGAYDEIFLHLRAGGVHRYSVVAPHHGLTGALRDAQLIQPVDPAQIPHWDEVDPHFRLDETTVFDGARYSVPVIFGTCPAIYNADLLPEPPRAWAELASDAYTGKVAMLDDGLSHFNLWGRVAGAADPPNLKITEMRTTSSMLSDLKRERVSHFTPYPGDMIAQIANGKALISTTGWEGLTLLPDRGNANIRIARLAPGDFSFVQALAIPAEAPNPQGAHQFIDFMLEAPEQAALANRTTRGIVNPGAVNLITEPIRALFDYGNLDAVLAQSPILDFPPLGETEDGSATYVSWVTAWERIKSVRSKAAP